MPSTSKKQARFMAAAAHNPKFAKRAGIKQSVAKEFNAADSGGGALKKAMGGRIRTGMAPAKRAAPANPGPNMANHMISAADQTLSDTGDRLRRAVGRVSGGRSGMFRKEGGKVVKKAEGGKVKAGLASLRALAKKVQEALDAGDTELAKRIKRQMEGLQPGASKDLEDAAADEEAIGAAKTATFAEGGKVKGLAMTLKNAMAEAKKHGTHLRKVEGEYQVKPHNKSWTSDSVYYTDDIDDAVGTAKLMNKTGDEE